MKRIVTLTDLKRRWDPVYTDGVSNGTTTYTSATASFTAGDVGKPITGTDIPANTTVASVTNGTTIVMSQAATGSHTGNTFIIGNRERNSIDVLIADIPMKSILDRHVVIDTIALAGPSLSAATARGFIMPDNTGIGSNLNAMVAGSADTDFTNRLLDLDSPVQLVLRVIVTGLYLSQLTAGQIEVHAYTSTLR
jgi:hypothetical protein